MKKITLFLFALFTCWQINAQVSSYSFSETTETYAQITGTTSTATGDDGSQNTIAIGFNFNFGGVNYTTFSINTNGWIRLGNTITTGSFTNALGNTAAYRPLIATFWDDNNMTGGEIRYSLTGTAPNQVLTVNWHNSKIGSTGSTAGSAVSTLLRLYETTNVIEMVYSTPYTTTNTVSASVGLNDATSFLSVTPAATSTVSSATANNAINATVMANLANKKLVFTPPIPCSGTPVGGTVSPATQTLLSGQVPAALSVTGQSSGVSGLTYQWEESLDGSSWGNATGGTGATTLSYTPPAFAGTMIMYRLRITCTISAASNVSTTAVLNPCGIYPVPSLETFATYVPGCWQEADNGDLTIGPATFGTSSWVADGPLNVGTTGAMRVNLDATGDNDWILSPLYTIPVNYELKFDASAHQWNSTAAPTTAWETDDFVEVLVSTGTTNWTPLYTYNNTNVPSNTGTPNVIDLDAYAGQTVRFAFRGVEGATNGGADIEFIIDNFEVRETPPCIEPTTLSTGIITANSAELFWVDPTGTQFDFEYVVQPAGGGTPVTNGTTISDVTVIEGSLSPNTSYEFWVRADCGGSGYSAWVGPLAFRTPCANFVSPWTYDVESAAATTNSSISDCWTSNPTNTTALFRWDVENGGTTPSTGTGPSSAYSGTKYFYTEASSGATGAIAYLTPVSVDVTALTTPYLEFYYHMFGVNMGTLEVEVFDGTVWTSIWSLTGQQQTTDTAPWLSAGIDMSSYAVSNILTFRFKATRGAGFEGDMSLDNISVNEAPACIAPTSLALVNVGIDDVTFSWIAGASETQWEYVIQPQGTGIPSGSGTLTTLNPLTVNTGLTSNTSYEIYIRAYCSLTEQSVWVGPLNFRTNIEVVCGTPVNTIYCYDDNDTTTWTFTSSDGSPLRITFNAGQIESCCDDILIYDGTNNTGTLLYQGNNGGNLAGLTFDSTSDSLFIEIDADGSVSCGDASYTTQWDFTVACATCVNPTATYTVVPNCATNEFSIDVNLTNLGSATSVSISDGTTTLTTISALGIQTFGPYTSGSPVTIVVTNEQDGTCTLSSGALNYTCPPANDNCVNAIAVNCGDVVTGSTASGATDSGNNASADVWYSYNGAAGDVTVSLCTNTTYDSYLRIFDACGGTQLAFNDDGCGAQSTVTFTANGTSTYYIMVEGFGTNTGAFEMTVTCVLSNGDFVSDSFTAYPNPVKDVLNLAYTSDISSVRVVNMIGQEVISKNINATSSQVDMSHLSAGTYIVNVTVGDSVKTLKVVKQ